MGPYRGNDHYKLIYSTRALKGRIQGTASKNKWDFNETVRRLVVISQEFVIRENYRSLITICSAELEVANKLLRLIFNWDTMISSESWTVLASNWRTQFFEVEWQLSQYLKFLLDRVSFIVNRISFNCLIVWKSPPYIDFNFTSNLIEHCFEIPFPLAFVEIKRRWNWPSMQSGTAPGNHCQGVWLTNLQDYQLIDWKHWNS